MAKKNMHSFKKFQKEQKRKEKADEKLARRQGKKDEDESLRAIDEQDPSHERSDEL